MTKSSVRKISEMNKGAVKRILTRKENKKIKSFMHKITKKKAAGEPLSEEENQAVLHVQLADVKKTVDNLKKTATVYKNVFEGICGEFNCRQFQMIGQDLESILVNIHDLDTNGPSNALADIPLEDSELSLEEASPGFNPEIVQ